MGVAALVVGILGVLSAIIPSFLVTQLIAIALGIGALFLGVFGRKGAAQRGAGTGVATAGIVLGLVAMVLGSIFFAACAACKKTIQEAKTGATAADVCTELVDDRCANPTDRIAPDVSEIHVVCVSSINEETFSVRWIAEDVGSSVPRGHKIGEATGAVRGGKNGRKTIKGHLTRPTKGWPTGRYRVEVRLGTVLACSKRFTIG